MRTIKGRCPICHNPLLADRKYNSICIYYVCSGCNAVFDYKIITVKERDRLDCLVENALMKKHKPKILVIVV